MAGSDNPLNLLPLESPYNYGTHLMLPLNFQNYEISLPVLRMSVCHTAKLLDANEHVLADMNEAYIKALSCHSIAMQGNQNAKGPRPASYGDRNGARKNWGGIGSRLGAKGNENAAGYQAHRTGNTCGEKRDWPLKNIFDAALVYKISNLKPMYKLFVKGYAPNDDRKYVEKFGKMVKKSKRKSMMKPKYDADKSAHKKLKAQQSPPISSFFN